MTQTLQRADTDLKKSVLDELWWTPAVNSTHIGVGVNDGAVTLSGEVDTYPERLLAVRAAQRVRGVVGVAQEITVRTTGSAVTDTDLAREAGAGLASAVDVPDTVKVAVHDHDVTLSGAVGWNYEREAAHRSVQYIKGVRNVFNTVVLRPRVAPAGIRAAIEAALLRNAHLESDRVTVTTDVTGVVTVTGRVQSPSERRQAENVCWAAPGVTDVINHLQVGY